jgi:DNA-binding GntR family transcriptional regulator
MKIRRGATPLIELMPKQIYTVEDIYHALKHEILMLKRAPGSTISENEVAARFGLSRTPVRAAFAKLRAEDLIYTIPQKGSFVTYLDFDYIMQMVYMREKVEHHILMEAIERQTPLFIDKLKRNLLQQKKQVSGVVDPEAFFTLDSRFHQACYAQVGRQKLWDALQQIDHQYIRYRILYYSVSRSFQILYREHYEMFQMITGRHLERAIQFCQAHLNGYAANVNEHVLNHYGDFFANNPRDTDTGE